MELAAPARHKGSSTFPQCGGAGFWDFSAAPHKAQSATICSDTDAIKGEAAAHRQNLSSFVVPEHNDERQETHRLTDAQQVHSRGRPGPPKKDEHRSSGSCAG